MSVALARPNAPEAGRMPERLTFKTAESVAGGLLDVDESQGIVTAIVSVTGVVDEVDDIIVPGAYAETLAKRNPKVVWAHSWSDPIGKTLAIEELMPGDKRLPSRQRDGSPWPAAAGALVASMQFNLRTTAGKDAFEVVRFYSESGECEYSIGYMVPPGRSSKNREGTRLIKMLELYELSVVLFGAHTMTGTLSIKSRIAGLATSIGKPGVDLAALARGIAGRPDTKAAPPFAKKPADEPAGPDLTPEDPAVEPEPAAEPEEPAQPPVDHSDGIMVAVFPDPDAADAIANHISGPDNTEPRDQLHVTLGYLGKVGEVQVNEQDVYDMLVAAVEGQEALAGEIGGIGQFPAGDDGTPTWAPVDVPGLGMLREQVVGALGDLVRSDHGFTPHMTLGYDIGLIDPVPSTPVTFTAVSLVFGNSRRDISLGAPVVDDGGAVKGYDPAVERKAEGGADRDRGNAEDLREYWTTGEGGVKIGWGTPGDFTRCVGLLEEHMPGRAEGYCANRHKEATGMWPGDRDNKGLDTVPLVGAPVPAAEVKAYPQMPGSDEERHQAIHRAIAVQYVDDVDEQGNQNAWVDVRSTWAEMVLYGVSNYRLHDSETQWFLAPYQYDAAEDLATLGEAKPVDLAIVPVSKPVLDDEGDVVEGDDEDWGLADSMPLVEDIYGMALTIKTAHQFVTEGKAGRVLSGANERALRTAMEHMLAVLAAAGLIIDTDVVPEEPVGGGNSPGKTERRRQVDPRADTGTTSPPPAAGKSLVDSILSEDNGDGTVSVDIKSLEAALAALDED